MSLISLELIALMKLVGLDKHLQWKIIFVHFVFSYSLLQKHGQQFYLDLR